MAAVLMKRVPITVPNRTNPKPCPRLDSLTKLSVKRIWLSSSMPSRALHWFRDSSNWSTASDTFAGGSKQITPNAKNTRIIQKPMMIRYVLMSSCSHGCLGSLSSAACPLRFARIIISAQPQVQAAKPRVGTPMQSRLGSTSKGRRVQARCTSFSLGRRNCCSESACASVGASSSSRVIDRVRGSFWAASSCTSSSFRVTDRTCSSTTLARMCEFIRK
mmetsp:Transcript_26385/g.49589  ORF Transcript_26385/g.49589 Transcript_26385/m.49589 type:complete len:218 (+) Transcript_26385:98-751(+)